MLLFNKPELKNRLRLPSFIHPAVARAKQSPESHQANHKGRFISICGDVLKWSCGFGLPRPNLSVAWPQIRELGDRSVFLLRHNNVYSASGFNQRGASACSEPKKRRISKPTTIVRRKLVVNPQKMIS